MADLKAESMDLIMPSRGGSSCYNHDLKVAWKPK